MKSDVHADFFQCEWLLGDRKPSPEDLDKGIDTNSPLFQAILENPVVQLGLTNPKTLLGKSCVGSCWICQEIKAEMMMAAPFGELRQLWSLFLTCSSSAVCLLHPAAQLKPEQALGLSQEGL